MKIEALFLIGVGIFFGCVGVAYWTLTYFSPLGAEAGGTVMLGGTCTLGLLPGLYYLYWYRRMRGSKFFFWGKLENKHGIRHEDRPDATIAEGAGIINSFPGSSIWPFVMGMGAFLLLLGLVFGVWIAIPGVSLMVSSLVGVTAESRRGGHI
jgi:hypothetical protein